MCFRFFILDFPSEKYHKKKTQRKTNKMNAETADAYVKSILYDSCKRNFTNETHCIGDGGMQRECASQRG